MAANHVGSPGLVFEPILTEARVASWFHQSSPRYTHMVRRVCNHHLDLLSLMYSRSATDRIEQDGMRQGRRIEELLHQASHFNNALFYRIPKTSRAAPNSSFELSRGSSSSVLAMLESVPSRPRPRLDQVSAGVYFKGSQQGHAGFSNGIRA